MRFMFAMSASPDHRMARSWRPPAMTTGLLCRAIRISGIYSRPPTRHHRRSCFSVVKGNVERPRLWPFSSPTWRQSQPISKRGPLLYSMLIACGSDDCHCDRSDRAVARCALDLRRATGEGSRGERNLGDLADLASLSVAAAARPQTRRVRSSWPMPTCTYAIQAVVLPART